MWNNTYNLKSFENIIIYLFWNKNENRKNNESNKITQQQKTQQCSEEGKIIWMVKEKYKIKMKNRTFKEAF